MSKHRFIPTKMKLVLTLSVALFIVACKTQNEGILLEKSPSDLHFDALPTVWDEGIPLGNGMVGALIWQKDGKLRMSLDRADLWDLRPMENLKLDEYDYNWVYEQWKKDEYKTVQERYDIPYDRLPAPSKIPGAALEFDIASLGEVASVRLYLNNAICEVKWKNGVRLLTFVDAKNPVGRFRFEGLKEPLNYQLIPPAYNKANDGGGDPVTGQDLRRLEYPMGEVVQNENGRLYEQEGWGGFKYQVQVSNTSTDNGMAGAWSISSSFPDWDKSATTKEILDKEKNSDFNSAFTAHSTWWEAFWEKSSLQVPDSILQKQWYLEQYKFGSAARADAPPISLQSVWTADNGKLPPWKGDFHHDLNTQLSYWPAYSGNHLDLEIGFLNWLWKNRETFKKYTKSYYKNEGLNVPGVTTMTGEPMGGWIQYAMGPTVGAWLGQHFYLHWRYSMDRDFLVEKAYPWISDVAKHLESIMGKDKNGRYKLPISASPEFHDNSREAWFGNTTNFDLALIRWTFGTAAELATELEKSAEARHWSNRLEQWPDLAVDEKMGLMISPDEAVTESHRHHSHQLGYHPLGLVDYSNGKEDRKIIDNTLARLDSLGSSQWVGYSFSWLGNMKARAMDGEGAAEALKIFATSFCLPNSFHVNGDQSGKGYSEFTYRPFTLEGNFAFASGLQEMLIQSHTGTVLLFPAVPKDWGDVSFNQLRTEGAFLVSAKMEKGRVIHVGIVSEKGELLKLRNPFKKNAFSSSKKYQKDGDLLLFETTPGETITLKTDRS
ncbi:alpha-L-fucosidase 2 [Pricia antarctica]|uniref:Alpha-L-fucosidase 2 n=2 Tax=Pricia antarctica TaxID=641691 RepID=A0A1G6YD65_9FLAO|nr:alpha-L-fucosidase 2 [Pricia antarctica]